MKKFNYRLFILSTILGYVSWGPAERVAGDSIILIIIGWICIYIILLIVALTLAALIGVTFNTER